MHNRKQLLTATLIGKPPSGSMPILNAPNLISPSPLFPSPLPASPGFRTSSKKFPNSVHITKEKQELLVKLKALEKERLNNSSAINRVNDEISHLTDKVRVQHGFEKKEGRISSLLERTKHFSPFTPHSRFDGTPIESTVNIRSPTPRRSSIMQDVYEVKHTPTPITPNKTNGFSKEHVFDVYLDPGFKLRKRERLPSLVNLYDSTLKLNLLEKFNAAHKKDFHEAANESQKIMLKSKPKFDNKKNALLYNNTKIQKPKPIIQRVELPSLSEKDGKKTPKPRKLY